MRRARLRLRCVAAAAARRACAAAERRSIGSKEFTESVILGEMATQLGARRRRRRDAPARARRHARAVERAAARRYRRLSRIHRHDARTRSSRSRPADRRRSCARALARARRGHAPAARLQQHLRARHARANARGSSGIRRISDLPRIRELRSGLLATSSSSAPTAGRACAQRYQLAARRRARPRSRPRVSRLARGAFDVTDLYSTDAEIAHYDLRVLDDDRALFPASTTRCSSTAPTCAPPRARAPRPPRGPHRRAAR